MLNIIIIFAANIKNIKAMANLLSKNQAADYQRHDSVRTVLNKESAVYDTYLGFKTVAGLYNTNLGKIDTFVKKYQESHSSDVTVKTDNKKAMCYEGSYICSLELGFLKATDQLSFISLFDFSKSDLFKLRDLAAIQQCNSIVEKATDFVTQTEIDYKITPADIQTFQNSITAFTDSLGTVIIDKETKLSVYDHITNLFVEQNRLLDILIDMVKYYEKHDKGFNNRFTSATRYIDPAVINKVNLKGNVTNKLTGLPIRQAVVTITVGDLKFTTKTTKKGNFKFSSLESGLYLVEITHFSYLKTSIEVDVYDDDITKVAIEMVK